MARLDNFCCECAFFKNVSQVESFAVFFFFFFFFSTKCFEGYCQKGKHTHLCNAVQISQCGNCMSWIFATGCILPSNQRWDSSHAVFTSLPETNILAHVELSLHYHSPECNFLTIYLKLLCSPYRSSESFILPPNACKA